MISVLRRVPASGAALVGRCLAARRLPWPYLVAIFAGVQLAYIGVGVRYDASSLSWFYQYLDPDLLRSRLLESVLYLHSQPPLFNLFLGIVLKLAPADPAPVFWAAYLACGLVFYLALFQLLIRLGLSKPLALGLSTWFMASPSFVLYEHWLFYTFPLAMLVTLSALLLTVALDEGKGWQFVGFFSTLFLLCGIRSLFHWFYYLAVAAAIVLSRRRDRRRTAVLAMIPFVLVLSLSAKTYVLFGKFTTSTWLGMSFWTMTTRNIPQAEREAMVARGELSPISLIDRYSELQAYPPSYLEVQGYEDIPAVRQVQKRSGFSNYNHLAYIAISDQYLEDALRTLWTHPRYFLLGNLRSWYAYFRSSSDYDFLRPNQYRITTVNNLYDYLFYGKVPYDLAQLRGVLPIFTEAKGHFVYLFLLVGLPSLVLSGLRLAFAKDDYRRTRNIDANRRFVILYLCFNVVYVALLGNALETGENNRFRFMTDPLALGLLGLFLQHRLFPVLRRKAECTPRSTHG